jgi:hypothetical protein
MKTEFIKTTHLIEFLPSISYYRYGGKSPHGSLTFAWFKFAIKFYIS